MNSSKPARSWSFGVAAAALAMLSSVGVSAQAANIAAGKEKANAVCAACHGADGITSIDPSYPKLAGQYPDYLARALSDYKSGARKNAIMMGMAAPLTKEEIANLSAYYASLPSPLSAKK